VIDTLWSSTKDTEDASRTAQGTDAPTNKEKEEMRPSLAPIIISLMFILTVRSFLRRFSPFGKKLNSQSF